ncbi:tubulin binding cofactor A [Puccinia sorghi]|uniref:Tubulin-specific chaperone A n=1 Tax=Puccinia sorghi TaxID=27349 RepID=A0A0L6UDR3_9BASI|nr:tubulin binding cofactor A [Puccinia sorghi]
MASRPLKIKTGVVERLMKEEESYKREYETQVKRIERVRQETPEDDWNIRKQKEVLDETVKMIPDVKQRLSKAIEELKDLVSAHETELAGTEELAKAQQVLSLAASRKTDSTEATTTT